MTAQSEVSKEVSLLEEKEKMSDLTKPDTDQAGIDPDNSYVFVTGADDGLIEPEVVPDAKGSSVEPEAAGKLDVVNGELLKEAEIVVPPVLAVNGVHEVGDVVQSAPEKTQLHAEAQIEHVGDPNGSCESAGEVEKMVDRDEKVQGVVGTEIGKVEEDPKLDPGSSLEAVIQKVAVSDDEVVETEIKQFEDSVGRLESSGEAAVEKVGDQMGKKEAAENEFKQVKDSDEILVISEAAAVEDVAMPNGQISDVVETEIKNAEDSNGKLESLAGGAMENVLDHNIKVKALAEIVMKEVEDSKGRLESSDGGVMENLGDRPGTTKYVVENEIKKVEDSNGIFESCSGGAMENVADQNEKIEAVVETEIKEVECLQEALESSPRVEVENVADLNGRINGEVEIEVKQVDDSSGRLVSLDGAEIERVVDHNETMIGVVETEIKQVEDTSENLGISVTDQIERIAGTGETEIKQDAPSNRRLESSTGDFMEKVMNQTEKTQDVVKIETKMAEGSSVRLEVLGDVSTEKVADQNEKTYGLVETEIKKVVASNESLVGPANEKVAGQHEKDESVVETEIKGNEALNGRLESSVVDQNGKNEGEAETEAKLVGDQDGTLGSSARHELNKVVGQEGRIEHVAEAEFKEVEDSNGKLENSVGTVMERVVNQNQIIEGEIKLENNKDQKLSALVENQEPEVGGLRLVTEAKEDEKSNDLSACPDEVNNIKDAPEDQYNLDSGETSGVSQISQKVVADAVERDVSMDGENEVKLKREVVEPMEQEVHLGASVDSDLESCPINDKEEAIKENAETASDVKESQERDAASVFKVQEGLEPVDETKNGVSTDDCNMETFPDEGLQRKIKEDFAASHDKDHVENAEEPEKQPDAHAVSPKIVQSEADTEASVPAKMATDVNDIGDDLDSAGGTTNENLLLKENADNGKGKSGSISMASPEGSSLDVIPEAKTSVAAVTKAFNYLIRIPRFNNESLQEQIRQAKLEVDEKTKHRDAIQKQIQEKRANSQIHGVDYEYAKGEDRSARKLVRAKRMEIDALQVVINKAKNAISIEDINSRIYNMEHMIQHETLPLKEEKQFIREIKQLKQLKEQLSLNIGSRDEIKQALEQKEEAEHRLKNLRKELDILKETVAKTESAAAGAGRKYDDEYKKVRELQAEYRAADDVRQEAYVRWQCLRKELAEKNKHFFKFKNDAAAAHNYAFSRDRQGLYRHCVNQVENFMELWNTNEEFRGEYTNVNARSTVRRLGTFDGRSLGPDEERPILPSYDDKRVDRIVVVPAKVDCISQSPSELKQETLQENGKVVDITQKKVTELKLKTKVAEITASGNGLATVAEITASGNGLATVSGRATPDEVQKEPVKSREEIELERKAEEKRKIEAEAKLKEQRRLEEVAKANEARERKKRHAEKVQMRAELKAQKEAEQKEKEKERRLRKKERKNVAATEVNDSNNSESAPISESAVETSKEINVKAVPTKKPKKASTLTKQTKTKSIPPPLRNRNRKKWQQYAWVAATSLMVFILFWLGNLGLFSNLKRRGAY